MRTGEARTCAALVPVEGTIDTYPLRVLRRRQVDPYCFVERSCVESWFVGHANLEEVEEY